MPMSALTMPQWSMMSALVMTVSTAPGARRLRLAHAVADDLAAAEFHFLAEMVSPSPPRREFGVGEADAVADGGAEHVGIGGAGEMGHAVERSHHLAAEAEDGAAARDRPTNVISRFCPGSKRMAVPAGMSRRKPRASARSKSRASLVSKK